MTGTPMEALEMVLRERLAGTLPGLDAQLRFMPTPPRSGWKPGEFPSDARLAAGLLLLYPGERGPSIPLTVRASGLRRHAGQRVRVLGELTPVHVLVSGFTLHPIVGITDERPSFTPAAHEVEEVIEVSVEDLQDASAIRQGRRTREGVAIEYPYFDLMGHQVWGATAMILGEFICVLGQGEA